MYNAHYLSAVLSPQLKFDSDLRFLVDSIKSMNLVFRKAMLSFAQTGLSLGDHPYFDNQMLEAMKGTRPVYDGYMWGSGHLERAISVTSRHPVYRSFISNMLRCESFEVESGYQEVLLNGTRKELLWSQHKRADQVGIYAILDADTVRDELSRRINPEVPLTPSWAHAAQRFSTLFREKVERIGILFPRVQRTKNMGQQTCKNLFNDGYNKRGRWWEGRTLDLELHNMATGRRIGGPSELRVAWRYNELKPRPYYCIGGDSHWRTRYQKGLSMAAADSWPSTSRAKRRFISDLSYFVQEDDFVFIWDLETFTTSLSELKFFLYWNIKKLEADPRDEQRKIPCFDYAEGVVYRTLSDLMWEYAEDNIDGDFSIHRIVDQVIQDQDETDYIQHNNGMLGSGGNINWSMTFHGFWGQAVANTATSGVGVGDDELIITRNNPYDEDCPTIRHIQLIGTLHPEKSAVLPPISSIVPEGDRVWKFLKRRIELNKDGITIDWLSDFPMIVHVYGIQDDFHVVRPQTKFDVLYKFCAQSGRFLTTIFENAGLLHDDEHRLIRAFLTTCYRKLGLPFNGQLPGFPLDALGGSICMFVVPPIIHDVTAEDWRDIIWSRSENSTCLLPVTGSSISVPSFVPQGEFTATSSRVTAVLIDVGCIVEVTKLKELVYIDNLNLHRFKEWLAGSSFTVSLYRFTDFCPAWFSSITSSDKRSLYVFE
jgi:hypothetical protein